VLFDVAFSRAAFSNARLIAIRPAGQLRLRIQGFLRGNGWMAAIQQFAFPVKFRTE
jgi:hypothetical protein